MNRIVSSLMLTFAATACARARSDATMQGSTAVSADSVVGRVSEVGADPMTWMSLRPSNGGAAIRLTGSIADKTRAVAGADVWVMGERTSDGFRVDAFEVRRVNDAPVDDGVIVVASGRVAVRLPSGTERDVPNAPPAMRDLAGARVWVTRPVSGVAPSYGVIERP